MARKNKTIRDIENQRYRALQSLRKGEPTIFTRWGRSNGFNYYIRSQAQAFDRLPLADKVGLGGNSTDYAIAKSNLRERQINRAADNAIRRLNVKQTQSRILKGAQGLSAG